MDVCLDNLLPLLKEPEPEKVAKPVRTVAEMRQKAEAGDRSAQWIMGLYSGGKLKQREEADRWFHLAAANGYAEAAFLAGIIWADPKCSPTGTVSEADLRRSRQWYRRARKIFERLQNTVESSSLYHLGMMCERGLGGPVDVQAAADWYRVAIRKGCHCHASLMQLLGEWDIEPLDKCEKIRCVLALRRSSSDEDQAKYRRIRKWLLSLPRSSIASDRALYQEIRANLPTHLFRLFIRPLPPPWQAAAMRRGKPGRRRKAEA